MAVELARAITITPHKVIRPYVSIGKLNLKLIDAGKTISQKIAFEASMQRAQLNQKYWDDILEKLRKSGGGGGSSRFDRITVSMQLTNFLSNKTIQAMLRNFAGDLNEPNNNAHKNILYINNNASVPITQKIGNWILRSLSTMLSLNIIRNLPLGRLYNTLNKISQLASVLSFQLNKLKEILEEDLKELTKKLDVKGKVRNIKIKIFDIVVTIEDKLIETLELFGVLSKKLFTFN